MIAAARARNSVDESSPFTTVGRGVIIPPYQSVWARVFVFFRCRFGTDLWLFCLLCPPLRCSFTAADPVLHRTARTATLHVIVCRMVEWVAGGHWPVASGPYGFPDDMRRQ